MVDLKKIIGKLNHVTLLWKAITAEKRKMYEMLIRIQ